MARQAKEMECRFDVEFVAVSAEEVSSWRADLLLLLQLLKTERLVCTVRAHWVGAA